MSIEITIDCRPRVVAAFNSFKRSLITEYILGRKKTMAYIRLHKKFKISI